MHLFVIIRTIKKDKTEYREGGFNEGVTFGAEALSDVRKQALELTGGVSIPGTSQINFIESSRPVFINSFYR